MSSLTPMCQPRPTTPASIGEVDAGSGWSSQHVPSCVHP